LRKQFLESKDDIDRLVFTKLYEGIRQRLPRQRYFKQLKEKGIDPEQVAFEYMVPQEGSYQSGVLDYIMGVKLDEETGKIANDPKQLDFTQGFEGIASAFTGALGSIAQTLLGQKYKEENKTTSTEQQVGTDDITFGEGAAMGTAPSAADEALENLDDKPKQNPTKNLEAICKFFKVDFDFNALNDLLDQKEDLALRKKEFLTDEDKAKYDEIHNIISQAMDRLGEKIKSSRIFESDKAQQQSYIAAIDGSIANIKDLYLMEGYAVSEKPEDLQEVAAPKPGSLSQTKLETQTDEYYQNLRAHMIDSSKFLNKSTNAFFPFLAGIKTDEQREAAKTGSPEAMLQAGMSLVDAFKVKVMDLVHAWDVAHKWEGSGNKLSNTELKKNANEQFRENILNLAKSEPYADENKRIRPEIMQFILTVTPPTTKKAKPGEAKPGETKPGETEPVETGPLNWQMTQKGFDMGRINGELTRLLANLGKTSFAELRGMENSPELEAELDKIVVEESHFGTHVGLPGEERQHYAYLPIAQPVLDKNDQPVLDEKKNPKFKQATLQYFKFKPEDFKNYLKEIVFRLIANAEKLEKSPKNPPYAAGIRNPGDFGIERLERKTRAPKPANDTVDQQGTNLSPAGDDADKQVATYAHELGGFDPYGPVRIPTSQFAYEALEDAKPPKRRFKVVVR
jgi:hypothetical protein